jgi:predicted CoA-binding protein
MTTQEQINDFLAQRTLALIGVSRRERDFSRLLLRAFRSAGYTMHGVNPKDGEVQGETCFSHIRDIPVTVDGALLMVPPAALPQAIRDCLDAGVKRLWIYGTGHPKPLDDELRILCRGRQISVINGFCPMMFLNNSSWPHRLHGWIVRQTRAYRTVPA